MGSRNSTEGTGLPEAEDLRRKWAQHTATAFVLQYSFGALPSTNWERCREKLHLKLSEALKEVVSSHHERL